MSISKFTKSDYDKIRSSYAVLKEAASHRCRTPEELKLVQKAFDFANEAHKNVRRRSGEPYMLHPLEVAKIVVSDIGLGCKSICAALLHDVVEDTDYTVEDIRNLFGEKIASLVDGLTKIKTVLDNNDRKSSEMLQQQSMQAENFKRILLTLNDDVRVVLIKLADRLHNCRTIEYMPEHKRDKILSETMFIFIPLAGRLGLYGIKTEMENIWLRFKEPEAYRSVSGMIAETVSGKEEEIDDFVRPLEKALRDAGFDFEIKKRIKTPYSVWRKMQTKNITFDQVYDLFAIRIVFNTDPASKESERDQCYHVFSIVTGIYRYKPDRLRDWVKHPKANGYEALHCTLLSQTGRWFEVQIRTRRMDDIAERGIAAHWVYKQNGYITENESEMDKWLLRIKDILSNPDVNALELLDIIHNDLTTSSILVFTPTGDQKKIEKGDTALDFAYQIHTDIGNKAIAAKVNMRLVPLSTVLNAGDQVEIITAENEHPKAEWLQFLKTRKARAAVADYFKSISTTLPQTHSRNIDLVLKADGGNRFSIASCCNPIPGDPVIGFRSPDGSITVHKKSCSVAESFASKFGGLMVVPQWESSAEDSAFPVRLSMRGIDRVGLLNEISRYVSIVMGVNIRGMNISTEEGIFEGYIDLNVSSLEILDKMIEKLSAIEGIQSIIRTDI